MKELLKKLENLPKCPGVYLFKDKKGEIIYVGKAHNLDSRVRSYFHTGTDERLSTQFLRQKISDLEVLITDTDKEALILENNLIKKYKPRYNIRLRDDKTYFHLKLTTSERFPRLLLVRRPGRSKDLIFGPYASSKKVKETIRLLQSIFPLRRCITRNFMFKDRPCLNYQIGKCLAPCTNKVNEEEYNKLVDEVKKFLSGETEELIRSLTKEMEKASDALEFERASVLRDRIKAIKATLEKQKVEFTRGSECDVFGYKRESETVLVYRLGYRKGLLIQADHHLIQKVRLDDQEVLGSFLKQFYAQPEREIPEEILIPFSVEDQNLIEELLSEKKGKNVELNVPKKGEKKKLVMLARANAEHHLTILKKKKEDKTETLEQLKKILRLKKVPNWIECYDISNISGELAVGAMVKFLNAEPDKKAYRRYRIKTTNTQDDYQMMLEVLSRRFQRALREGQKLPDLVILDGGKGQLNIAKAVLDDLKIKDVELVSLAKERTIGDSFSGELKKKEEQVYLLGVKDPIMIKPHSEAEKLLIRIRDEAHRFAISYHRKLRKKGIRKSALNEIPGIGEKKKVALLSHFGSLEKIKEASLDELKSVPKISSNDAQRIKDFFSKSSSIPSQA